MPRVKEAQTNDFRFFGLQTRITSQTPNSLTLCVFAPLKHNRRKQQVALWPGSGGIDNPPAPVLDTFEVKPLVDQIHTSVRPQNRHKSL